MLLDRNFQAMGKRFYQGLNTAEADTELSQGDFF